MAFENRLSDDKILRIKVTIITIDIGNDVNIKSLQDTATYDSDQKNMGFSADIDIAGGGAGSSLSVNGGKTNVDADYQTPILIASPKKIKFHTPALYTI